jgi:hypothetical protein
MQPNALFSSNTVSPAPARIQSKNGGKLTLNRAKEYKISTLHNNWYKIFRIWDAKWPIFTKKFMLPAKTHIMPGNKYKFFSKIYKDK